MANYGRIKSTKIAPIGTIMPWGSGSAIGESEDNIPRGWIICNAATQILNADYHYLLKLWEIHMDHFLVTVYISYWGYLVS